ncbi:hypothetical protein KBD59_04645 [Candidatus Gracilibacteria bacterium]|nr:hypothetical protein [Candidatus Gracilibacteria bacterium]
MPLYYSRAEAGERLAQKIPDWYCKPDTFVVGCSLNGMPVAEGLARALNVPLEYIAVCRIVAPFEPEKTIGAVDDQGNETWHKEMVERYHASVEFLKNSSKEAALEAQRRMKLFRPGRPPLNLYGKNVILTDDGTASGYTMLAAVGAARSYGAEKVIVAVPVGTEEGRRLLQPVADEVVHLYTPRILNPVRSFYQEFPMIIDQDVVFLMERHGVSKSA